MTKKERERLREREKYREIFAGNSLMEMGKHRPTAAAANKRKHSLK